MSQSVEVNPSTVKVGKATTTVDPKKNAHGKKQKPAPKEQPSKDISDKVGLRITLPRHPAK